MSVTIRVVDDGAPQHNSATHMPLRTWVDTTETVQQGNAEQQITVRTATYEIILIPATSERVNAERDRRMSVFSFGGKTYDLGGQALINVSGAGTLALAAIINGAEPGDLRWSDPTSDFVWIAHDNTLTPMDAQTTWAFAQTAAAWRKHCIFKARALKDISPIPADFSNDGYWA